MIGIPLDVSPCLGKACFAGVALDSTTQTAGAVVMVAIVLGLAWYFSRKWKGAGSMSMAAPA